MKSIKRDKTLTNQSQNKRLDLPNERVAKSTPAYELGDTGNYGSGVYHSSTSKHYGADKEGSSLGTTILQVAGGVALAVAGGVLAWRGVSKSSGGTSSNKGVEVNTSQTVQQSPEEVYAFWRKLENLPRFMHHLQEVRELDGKRSHWSAKVPGGFAEVSWEAEIVAEEPGRFIAWRSLPGSQVDNSGEVRFEDSLSNTGGTTVHAIISYHPPLGAVGTALAGLFQKGFKGMVQDDLRRFKNIFETGSIPVGQETQARTTDRF